MFHYIATIFSKCQLSVSSIQTLQNVVGVLKKEVAFYCLFEGRGVGRKQEKWNFQFYFQPPTFCFTLLPLLYSVTESAAVLG